MNVGKLLLWTLGVAFVLGGPYALWLSVTGTHDQLDLGRFRPTFRLFGLDESTAVRRLFWAVSGVATFFGGVLFLAMGAMA